MVHLSPAIAVFNSRVSRQETHKWRIGRGHHRLDTLGEISESSSVERAHTSVLGPAVFPGGGSQTSALNRQETYPPPPQAWAPPVTGAGCSEAIALAPQADVALTMPSRRTTGKCAIADVTHAGGRDSGRKLRGAAVTGRQARARRAVAKVRQQRTAERLADATAAPPDPVGFQRSDFLCADGATLIPYAIVGASLLPSENRVNKTAEGKIGTGTTSCSPPAAVSAAVLSFVVVHDFFDTIEKTFLLFKPLVLQHPGCQVLCFNSPGQAGTRLPQEPEELLTNEWIADRLDELMQVRLWASAPGTMSHSTKGTNTTLLVYQACGRISTGRFFRATETLYIYIIYIYIYQVYIIRAQRRIIGLIF